MFTDKIEIEVRAGKGGDGKLSFRHEKFVAKGGPDGGNGGNGGNVIFEVDHNLNTLSYFRAHKLVKAEDGKAGQNKRRAGRAGEPAAVSVPLGTTVWEDGRLIADLAAEGEQATVAKGGAGGYGNAHFASSKRQSPRIAELGEPGETKHLTLELKLVADVGLVGLPNSGKSTLLSVISNARPEIADYPFTTLIPNLGVVDTDDFSFVAADIPGLIKGASKGKGLGDEFLRHIERTAIVWHLVDSTSADPVADWRTVQAELKAYSPTILKKPQLVVVTKIDAIQEADTEKIVAELSKATKIKAIAISAVAHKGLDRLLKTAVTQIKGAKADANKKTAQTSPPVIDETTLKDDWQIKKTPDGFMVNGHEIERFALRTNFTQSDSVSRFRHILSRYGIAKELTKRGIKPGQKLYIAGRELEW